MSFILLCLLMLPVTGGILISMRSYFLASLRKSRTAWLSLFCLSALAATVLLASSFSNISTIFAQVNTWSIPQRIGPGSPILPFWEGKVSARPDGNITMVSHSGGGSGAFANGGIIVANSASVSNSQVDINNTTRNGGQFPKIATDFNNNSYVVWRHQPSGYRAYARTIGPNLQPLNSGVDIGDTFRSAPASPGVELDQPAVAALNGRMYVTGQVQTNPPGWGFAESLDGGNTWVNYHTISDNRPAGDIAPSICVTPAGDVHVAGVWGTSMGAASRINGLWTRLALVAVGGETEGDWTYRNPPAVGCGQNGSAYVTWASRDSAGIARFVPQSNNWSRLSSNIAPGYNVRGVSVAVSVEGNVWVALATNGGGVGPGTVVINSTDLGQTFPPNLAKAVIPRQPDNATANIAYTTSNGRLHVASNFKEEGTREGFYSFSDIAPPPPPPTNLAASSPSTSQINLTWQDISQAFNQEDDFVVERAPGGVGNFATLAVLPANTTSYQDGGLSINTTYRYRAYARKGGRISVYSNEVSFSTLPAVRLVFLTQPSGSGQAGAILATQPKVAVYDPNGNLATNYVGNVTFEAINGLSGETAAVAGGIATFSAVKFNLPGNGFKLKATAPNLTDPGAASRESIPINITALLEFKTQPANTLANATMPSVVVRLKRVDGSSITGYNATITLKLRAGSAPASVILTGGTPAVPINTTTGEATFSGLKLDTFGSGYQLEATANDPSLFPNVISNPFAITAGLLLSTPNGVQEERTFSLTATVTGNNGVTLSTYNGLIYISGMTSELSGIQLDGPKVAYAVGGVATFNPMTIDRPGNKFVISVRLPNNTSASTNEFDVGAVPGCNRMVVTSISNDGGDLGACRITLRHAVEFAANNNPGDNNKVIHIRIGSSGVAPNAGSNVIDLNGGDVTVPNGIGLDAGCNGGPGVNIRVSGGARLVLRGNNFINGINIIDGGTKNMFILDDGSGNPSKGVRMGCVK